MNDVTEFKYDDVSVRLDSLKAGVTFMHDEDFWMLTNDTKKGVK